MPPPLPQSPAQNPRFALSATEMQDWLASLPMRNSPEAGRCIVEQLAALNRSRCPLRERLVLTSLLRDAAEQVLPDLEAQVTGTQVPLPGRLRTLARLIDELLAKLAIAYKLAVTELPGSWFRFGIARRLHMPITRNLQMLARRLLLAHRTYAPPPPLVWQEMHALYALARRHHVEKLGLSGPEESPLGVYRNALLLAFCEPHKLMQGELSRACEFIAQNGELAVFIASVPLDPVDGLFLVQPGRDAPGASWGKRHTRNIARTVGPEELVLNTARLADRALEVAEAAAGATEKSPLPVDSTPQVADLLRRLVRHWIASPNRQFSRLRRHTRVDICVGLHGIWRFLRAPSADGSVHTSEWMVTNESAGGFALMHISGPLEPVGVGELLGVRSRDSDRVHICVVRWVLSDSPEHVELGLEELAPNAKPVSIAKLATSGAAPSHAEPGLLLPEIPALKRAAAIVALPGRLDAASEFHLEDNGQRGRATHLVEQTLSVELFGFSPLN